MHKHSQSEHEPRRPDAIGRAIDGLIRFCLENKLIVFLLAIAAIGWGLVVVPFDYDVPMLPRDRVPVDALPDVSENQQIVFTEWSGRSPRDVEDQVTYPLTVAMLSVPGVESVRSFSYFGFSTVYVVFEEGVDFYWSRSRILERLNSAQKELPAAVTPTLGPDATALGQIFWYTLEGRDPETGEPVGGWGLDELRTLQDWYVRLPLQSAEGVAEVASVGGFVKEYWIEVDPDRMRSHDITLAQVYEAVRKTNLDVGARTVEINRVEYVIRGLGFVENLDDLRQTVVKSVDGVPVLVDQVAHVTEGPALRRGALDKGGAEAVGGVVVARFGENPMAVIENTKRKIDEISAGLPQRQLDDGRISKVTVVPFYDRTELIHETLGTLEDALIGQVLMTIIVVVVMVMHLRSSLLISSMLPLAVLFTFIAMHTFGVTSNIMSLVGIAIAIGTMVDMGVVLCESILRQFEEAGPDEPRLEVVHRAASEVGRPVLTAILTTVISFLPVFVMVGSEGKLFRPLAFTKTFALLASVIVALTLLPPMAHLLFGFRRRAPRRSGTPVPDRAAGHLSLWERARVRVFGDPGRSVRYVINAVVVVLVWFLLARHWRPLGWDHSLAANMIFIGVIVATLLAAFLTFQHFYEPLLRFFLRHKGVFYLLPATSVLLGLMIWLGFANVFAPVPWLLTRLGMDRSTIVASGPWEAGTRAFPGLGEEFMPPLDEGSFLLMPTTMPHASIGEALDVLQKQDMAIEAVPEVDTAVGKIGRVDSPLDPAPVSMIETIITYKPEYGPVDPDTGARERNWRDHIRSPRDIWREIEKAARVPGTTGAPHLQPIKARMVMLESGVRAPIAAMIRGQSLEDIEQVAMDVERLLKEVPLVNPDAVTADRVVGKPYLQIDIDRAAIARYGLTIRDVQRVIETAIGGARATTTVEGRQRYAVRVRYPRERRDSIESIRELIVAAPDGLQIPLGQLARIEYQRGPMVIKSVDTQLVAYVTLDKREESMAEVEVVEAARAKLDRAIEQGELRLPAGVERPTFIGSYENQVRSAKTLAVVIPLALLLIFILLYLQFRSVLTTMLVFAGVFIACSGGFLMIYAYSLPWFADFSVFGENMRDLFQMGPINLSVAVWVGFIALLGIATDDGVLVASYLDQSFAERRTRRRDEIREATVQAGLRRLRPCLMTTATTILALLPVLTSTGRGSDVMVPMAIPSFGGMLIELMTLFFVPVSYCMIQEGKAKLASPDAHEATKDEVADVPQSEGETESN